MKKLLFAFILMTTYFSMSAQTHSSEWFTNMEKAKEHAAKNNTDILMVFAGSDWCKPCIQLKKDILETTDFQNWASDKVTILYLDFPARKKNKLSDEQTTHNEALAERFNKSGAFPNVFIIDVAEKVLANPKFSNQTPEQFIADLQPVLTSQN